MRANKFIEAFLPKEDKFFVLIEQSTKNLVGAMAVFEEAIGSSGREARERYAKRLKEIEHEGDMITHCIYDELNSTFITPIDREDIHTLAGLIDDVLDRIESVGNRLFIYDIDRPMDRIVGLAGKLKECINLMEKLVKGLRTHKHDIAAMKEAAVALNTCENEGDVLYREALKEIFESVKDPVEIIKLKDLLQSLEGAIDKCEDVSNVIEQILIKYA